MNLTQQLEDKKKELPLIYYCKKCNRYTDVRYISDKKGGRYKSYCYKCSEEMLEPYLPEIAILEQAIAEMQKQRQEEIELLKTIEKWICKVTPEMQLDNEILREVCPNIFYNYDNRIEQLQSHIYRGNSSKEKDNQRVPISESATDELNNESKAHSQLSLQKQRQEILDKETAKKWLEELKRIRDIKIDNNFSTEEVFGLDLDFHDYEQDDFKGVIKFLEYYFKLNQPKTEKENSK